MIPAGKAKAAAVAAAAATAAAAAVAVLVLWVVAITVAFYSCDGHSASTAPAATVFSGRVTGYGTTHTSCEHRY